MCVDQVALDQIVEEGRVEVNWEMGGDGGEVL
jgi:hypothetical protein